MTFGVDECRRCGRAMKISAPNALAQYHDSLTRKPTMSEAEWRAEGWKAAPTRHQIHHVLTGVCRECKWALRNRQSNPKPTIFAMIFLVFALAAFVLYVTLFNL